MRRSDEVTLVGEAAVVIRRFRQRWRPLRRSGSLNSFRRRLSAAGRQVDAELPAGHVRWLDAQDHAGENIGDTGTPSIFVERSGAHQGDQVRGVDGAPAFLRGLNELERHGQRCGAGPGAAGDLGAQPAVEKADSIGLVARRWIQCPAG